MSFPNVLHLYDFFFFFFFGSMLVQTIILIFSAVQTFSLVFFKQNYFKHNLIRLKIQLNT